MELSAFRKRLERGDIHLANREALLKEYQYFSSIAPKSFLDRLKSGEIKEKISGMFGGNNVLMVILTIVLIPILFAVLAMGLPVLLLLLCIMMFSSRMSQNPEYKNYNYIGRIVELTMRLFDDKFSANYHYDPTDLVDEDMYYDKALVEARLVKPFEKRSHGNTLSSCSYDWGNANNTDSFEFLGYKIFYEWKDDDGNTHEVVSYHGSIYKFHTSFFVNGTVNIMSTKTKKGLLGGEKEVSTFKYIKNKEEKVIDTENHEFAENFDTIATYDEEAYKFLTPSMIETLLQLRRNYFFCICIKGNVMTVAVDDGGYKNAEPSSMKIAKPFFAPKNPELEMNLSIDRYRKSMLSIYELKDMLDPAGRFQNL